MVVEFINNMMMAVPHRLELWCFYFGMFILFFVQSAYDNLQLSKCKSDLLNTLEKQYTTLVHSMLTSGFCTLYIHKTKDDKYRCSLRSMRTGDIWCKSHPHATKKEAEIGLGLALMATLPIVLARIQQEVSLYGLPEEMDNPDNFYN